MTIFYMSHKQLIPGARVTATLYSKAIDRLMTQACSWIAGLIVCVCWHLFLEKGNGEVYVTSKHMSKTIKIMKK